MNEPSLQIPLVDLKAQLAMIEKEVRAAIDRVVVSQRFILGEEVAEAEREIAAYSGAQYGVGVSSGSEALICALMALDIGPGDEVITTPFSFISTAEAIARVGATPVFVDIEEEIYNLDPTLLEPAVTPKTRAVIPVHLYGQCAHMASILDIADRKGLSVIEDAAQAIGAEDGGRRAGAMGTMGCLSFFPSKNLGAYGDGGMVLTNDPNLRDRLQALRVHGASTKNHSRFIGGNFRLDALQAAVLRVKLNYLDEWTSKRQEIAALYDHRFVDADLPETRLRTPQVIRGRHVYHLYVIHTDRRDALMAELRQMGIGCGVYYPVPLHMQECFADLGYGAGSMPVAEAAARETLALPIYPELTEGQVDQICDAVLGFLQ